MKSVFLLSLIFFPIFLSAQYILTGKIVASDTKAPLAGASIFLTNTSVGSVTNSNGEFSLSIPTGKYELIASFVGYETSARSLSGAITEPILITLRPKAEVFDEVVVGPYDKDGWANWGRFFTENFIGTTDEAEDCKIENPETLRFRNNKKLNTLTAVATDPLIITNRALGYRIKYQLEDFQYDFNSRYLLYVGYPLFTPLEGGAAKQKRWKRNREDVYRGSMMNFMRAIFRNRIVEEGFEVRRLVKEPNLEKQRVKALRKPVMMDGNRITMPQFSADSTAYYHRVLEQPEELLTFSPYTLTGDSIAYAIDSVTAGLEFPNFLHITYKKAPAPERYRRLSVHNAQMRSEIKFIDVPGVAIQANGQYYPAVSVMSLGYWAWSEKIAGMLPFDYVPGN